MIRLKLISAFILLFSSLEGVSQEQSTSDSTQLMLLDIGVRGMWQTGNTSQAEVSPNLNFQIMRSHYFLEETIIYQYIVVNKFVVVNDLWNNFLFQYQQKKKFYPFVTLAGGTAKSYFLNYFLTTGAGVGSSIYQKSITEYVQIHAFVGYLTFEIGDYSHQALSLGSIIRANVNLGQNISLNWSFTSYHSTKQAESWGLQNNFKINFLLANGFAVNLNHRLFFNNQTVNEIKKLNTILLFGINYQFRKGL